MGDGVHGIRIRRKKSVVCHTIGELLANRNDLRSIPESLDVEANNELLSKKANKSSKSTVYIEEAPDGPDGELITVMGASSTMHRNKNGITVNFKTDGLIPGNAYTLWFVVFGDAPGPPSSTHAAGHIVGGSGKGNFSGHISVVNIFDNGKVFNTVAIYEVENGLITKVTFMQ